MIKCPHVCGEKLSRSGYALCVVQKSSVAPALNVCFWRRKADEIVSNSLHDRLSANVRFCNLRVCCDVDVHSRLDYRWRPKRLTNSGICDAGCASTCVRDRAYGVVAGSLIASRSQFAHAAYKTSYFEILELVFCKASSEMKFVLDRIALSGEPSK